MCGQGVYVRICIAVCLYAYVQVWVGMYVQRGHVRKISGKAMLIPKRKQCQQGLRQQTLSARRFAGCLQESNRGDLRH